jgi:hypothetical protein
MLATERTMFKAVFFLWRRKGMSRTEFVDYYENRHAGLMTDLVPFTRDIRRNYPVWQSEEQAGEQGGVELEHFDAMTEVTYEDRIQFEQGLAIISQSPVKETVEQDELAFLDRVRVKFLVVDEVTDDLLQGRWAPAPVSRNGMKLVRYVRRPANVTQTIFQALYETGYVSSVKATLAGCREYRRNYLCSEDALSYSGDHLDPAETSASWKKFDLIEVFWFEDRKQGRDALVRLSGRGTGGDPLADGPLPGIATVCTVELEQFGAMLPSGEFGL